MFDRTTTGDAEFDFRTGWGIELDKRLLMVPGIGVAFGERVRVRARDIDTSDTRDDDEVVAGTDRKLVERDIRVEAVEGARREDISAKKIV